MRPNHAAALAGGERASEKVDILIVNLDQQAGDLSWLRRNDFYLFAVATADGNPIRLALVGWYLTRKKQVVRPKFPAPFYKSLMCLGCSTQPAS